ncbi:unnamed protein product [Phytomonas sp. EM1]|nr:unnamed protein product [Phytomonas sp. EM1]|eukprot:CCW61776.1 unnamed protein product [Phytomonas sp. isolate EM1]
MEGVLDYGKQLYIQCCLRRKAKPNRDIIVQVDRPDLVLVEVIDASHTFIGRTGVLAILDFASQHRCLRKLILPQNDVDTACVEHLCSILKNGHPSLCSIDFSYSNLSVPAMRTLWKTARDVHTLTEVRLDNSDVPQEWAERLDHQLSTNREIQKKLATSRRLVLNPVDMASKWHTTFVLLISANDKQTELYSRHVLQVLSFQAAALSRRLASIVVGADETKEYIENKVQYCLEEQPQRRVWCVVLLDGTPFTDAQQLALDMVLTVQELNKKELSDVVESLFVYYPIQDKTMNELEPITSLTLSPSAWLALTGCNDKQHIESASITRREAYVLTPEIYKLRCQSDLLSSLRSAYLAGSNGDQSIYNEVAGPVGEMPRKIDLGPLQMSTLVNPNSASVKRLSKIVLHYIKSTPEETGAPLIIHGVAGVGKGEILRHLAQSLQNDLNEYSVFFIEIDSPNGGIVTFLYSVLQLLSPAAAQKQYYSTKALQLAVKEAAAGYSGPKRVAMIVSRVDRLELCGMEDATCVDWVPLLLPPRLRVVLSVDTDPTLLHHLRQRLPQPLECLIYPAGDDEGINAYCRMLTQRGLLLPGIKQGQTRDCLSATEKSYAQKPDSNRMFYSRLAAAYTEHLLKTNVVGSEEEAALLIQEQLPGSVEELIRAAYHHIATVYGQITVSWVLLSLTHCPLAAMDIEEVCERLGRCPAHTSVPALRHLVQLGLVEFDNKAKARLFHYALCAPIVLHLYANELDRVSVAVETHLHLMSDQNMDIHHNFRHLIPRMLANGNFDAAAKLLSDANLIDRMLSCGYEGFSHTMEAFFRLLSACDLVDKLAAAGQPLKGITLNYEKIECSLRDVQLARGPGFLQRCLLSNSESPLYHSAHRRLDHEGGGVLYSVLVPLKAYAEDQSSATLTSASMLPVIHLHCRGNYLVASTLSDVMVYDAHTLDEIAHMDLPFKDSGGDTILGSFVSIGSRVVILAFTRVLLWNFGANVSLVLEDTSAAVAPCSLDIFGDSLIVSQPAKSNCFSIVSVSQRQKIQELPPAQLSDRPCHARFCGPYPMVVESSTVRIFADSKPISLLHDGLVGVVDCSTDGQLVASAVGSVLWLWKSTGALLHRIDASLNRIAHLSFNPTGFVLAVERGDGVTVWQTATGMPLSRLLSPFKEAQGTLRPGVWFGGNGSLLLGRVGRHAVAWHAESGTPLGALTAHNGVFTRMWEHHNLVFTTLSSGGGVKVFDLATNPLPPTHEAKSGMVDGDNLWNGRVSGSGIRSVSMSPFPGSHLVAGVNRNGRLFVFSTRSGARLDRVVDPQPPDAPVHAAVVAGSKLVAYVSYASPCVNFLSLPEDAAPEAPATLTSRPIPRELLWEPAVDAYLYASHKEPSYVGLTYTYHGRNRMIVYKTDTPGLCFQLAVGGAIMFVSFLEQFAYTVEKGRWIRLWNLSKGLERTSYQHPHPIVVAAECRGIKNAILCLDDTETMYCVGVRNITSSTQASFILTKIELPNLRRSCSSHLVHFMACIKQSIVLLSAGSDEKAMRLSITAANRDDVLHETPIDGISCISIGVRNDDEVLVIGFEDGRILFYRVVEPTV